jgi:hypothetical protein
MFDSDAIREQVFADYVRLCKDPAWKQWAWNEVKRMDEEELFKGIKSHVLNEMNKTGAKNGN